MKQFFTFICSILPLCQSSLVIHIKNVSFELNACPAFQGNWFEFCMARAWQTFKDMDIKCFFKKCWGINYAGFCIWGVRAHTHVPAHPKQICKKSTLCQKLQGVWQIARPKQRFLSFTFYKTKILRENLVYLLFHWFSGENCVIFTFSWPKGR